MNAILRAVRAQLLPMLGMLVWLPFMVAICLESMHMAGLLILFGTGLAGITLATLAQCCARVAADRARSHGARHG